MSGTKVTLISVCPATNMSSVRNPIYDICKISFADLTVSAKLPSLSVIVQIIVPFIIALTPANGSPSLEITVPVIFGAIDLKVS